jgi:hypothetical protein
MPLLFSGGLALTACGGGGGGSTAALTPETAPATAVVPQANFSDEDGNLDTVKLQAVQDNYQTNLEVTQ